MYRIREWSSVYDKCFEGEYSPGWIYVTNGIRFWWIAKLKCLWLNITRTADYEIDKI